MSQHQRKWRLAEFCADLLGCLDVFGRSTLPRAKKTRTCRPGMESLEHRIVPDSAPVASDFSFSVHMNASHGLDLAGQGSDVDGDPISGATITSNPAHGTITWPDGPVYTPDAGFVGDDSFTFQVTDHPNGNSSITVNSNTATCSVDVTDTAPTAATDSITVNSGETSGGTDLIALGSDADDDSIVSASIDTGPAHGSVSLSGGIATYTANDDYAGDDSFTFKVNDGGMDSDPATISVTVNPVVRLTSPGDQMNLNHDTVSLPITATDTGGNDLTYSADGLPGGLSIDTDTGAITGTIANDADTNSPYTVTVTASEADDSSVTDSKTFSWEVDKQLLLLAIGDQYNVAGDDASAGVQYWETGSGTVTFSADGLPAGLSIDGDTGAISGTIGYDAGSGSPYSVTITATDSDDGVTNTATFNWNVAEPVVTVCSSGDLASVVGGTVNTGVAADSTTGDDLTFSAEGLPDGLTIDPNSGDITGTLASDADAGSPYSITVTATDEDAGVSGTTTFALTVGQIAVNSADQQNLVGDVVGVEMTANYAGSGTLAYSASGLPSGLSIDSGTGTISGTIATGAESGSPYSVTVTSSDGTSSSSTTFSWEVAALVMHGPGDQSYCDGDSVEIDAPTVSSIAGHSVSFAVTGLPEGLSMDSDGKITGTLTEDADQGGPYTITITASDTTANTNVTDQFTLSVASLSSGSPGSDPSDFLAATASAAEGPRYTRAQLDALIRQYRVQAAYEGQIIRACDTYIGRDLAGMLVGFIEYKLATKADDRDNGKASIQAFWQHFQEDLSRRADAEFEQWRYNRLVDYYQGLRNRLP